MAYLIEEETDPIIREKMRYWLRLEGLEDSMVDASSKMSGWASAFVFHNWLLPTREVSVRDEIASLKRRVKKLEERVGRKRELTMTDYVYELFRKELEAEHFGKIVAIDTESRRIAGIGDTLLEAYNKAREETGKDQFDFRRIGSKYVFRV